MTLRELFRNSAELLWQHPRLLLPVLLADVVKFVLISVEKPARIATIHALSAQSVFGGYGGPETISWPIALVAIMMRSLTYFVCIMGYVVALGILVNWVPRAQKADSLLWIWPRGMRTVSFLLLSCMLLFTVLASITSWLAWNVLGASSNSINVGFAFAAMIATTVFGWFVYSFVRENGNVDAPEASRWQSCFLLLAGVALGIALSAEVLHEGSRDEGLFLLFHQKFGWAIGLFLSLISAIPFALSFVAMSLRSHDTEIATSSVGESECFESVG